jgi:hypothetical protein
MRWGVDAAPIPVDLPFMAGVTSAALEFDFPPCFAYAIATTENVDLLSTDPQAALSVISGDNGHGLCQITPASWWEPPITAAWAVCPWQDPAENMAFALKWFLLPAVAYWNQTLLMEGDALIRCVAAEYNAGRSEAIAGHNAGNVDLYTEHGNYAARALANFAALVAGRTPWA